MRLRNMYNVMIHLMFEVLYIIMGLICVKVLVKDIKSYINFFKNEER